MIIGCCRYPRSVLRAMDLKRGELLSFEPISAGSLGRFTNAKLALGLTMQAWSSRLPSVYNDR